MRDVRSAGGFDNRRIDVQQVKDAGIAQFDTLCLDLLGEPSSRKGAEWRWGGKGSLRARVSGTKAGSWRDFESGLGGDALDLWAVYALGLGSARDDFRRVLETLASRLGITAQETDAQRTDRERRRADREAKAQTEADREAEAKARVVEAVRAVSGTVTGTPATAYLTSRGITAKPPFGMVRYHPAQSLGQMPGLASPRDAALVAYATDEQGQITGGQRILLDSEGRKLPVDTAKPMFGAMQGSAVRLPASGEDSSLYVAEGPETALSIWQATGAEVWAVLGAGNFQSTALPTDRRVVICPDQDAPDSPAADALAKALGLHHSKGVDLWIARAPEAEGSKRDLNDTLQGEGLEAVQDALAAAVQYVPVPKARPAQERPAPKPQGTRIFATARDFVEAFGAIWPAKSGTAPDASLIIAPDNDTAAVMHAATGGEVWVLGGTITDLEGLPPRRVVFALPDQGQDRRHLEQIAAVLADQGTDCWWIAAPEAGATREEVFASLKAACVIGDSAPVDLSPPPCAKAPARRALGSQKAIRDQESARLRDTLTAWVNRQALEGRGKRALIARYAVIDAMLESAPLSDQERARQKASAKRKARREVQKDLGLASLPTVRRVASGDNIAVTGSQGIGKTAALVGGHGKPGALHGASGALSLMVLPTTSKAAEAMADYLANAPAGDQHPVPILLRGRSQPDPDSSDGRAMCWIPAAADAAAKRGANVRRDLCFTCPFADQCAYLRQESEAEALANEPRGGVVFATHPFLTLPVTGGLTPDLLICDEAPAGLVEKVTLTPGELLSEFPEPPLSRLGRTPEQIADRRAELLAGLRQWVYPLGCTVYAGLEAPEGCLALLRDQEIGQAEVRKAINTLTAFEDAVAASAMASHAGQDSTPEALDSALGAALLAAAAPVAARLRVLFEAVALELDSPHDHPTGFALRDGKLIAWKAKALHHQAPLAYLDGTADMTIAQAQFGALTEHRFEVPRMAKVVQVVGRTFSDWSITGEGMTGKNLAESVQLRGEVANLIGKHPGCFVAGTKSVLAALDVANLNCRFGNFGALRGMNAFAGCSAAVIIGRTRPRPQAFEDEARAYAARAGRTIFEATEYDRLAEAVADSQGRQHAIAVERHPDPFVDAFRAQRVEAEIEQAIDRLRLIHAPTVRKVYLLNSYPTVTPDRVMTWADLRAGGSLSDRIKDRGFLPASGRECARVLPDLFDCEATARRFLTPSEKVRHLPKRVFLWKMTHFLSDAETLISDALSVTYRAKPSKDHPRPRKQTAYVWTADPLEARALIEAATGPLAEFDMLRPDPVEEVPVLDEIPPPEAIVALYALSKRVAGSIPSLRLPALPDLPRITHAPP